MLQQREEGTTLAERTGNVLDFLFFWGNWVLGSHPILASHAHATLPSGTVVSVPTILWYQYELVLWYKHEPYWGLHISYHEPLDSRLVGTAVAPFRPVLDTHQRHRERSGHVPVLAS